MAGFDEVEQHFSGGDANKGLEGITFDQDIPGRTTRCQSQWNPRMTSDDSPVGYGRPPVHSRFQKGQSGNPRGRPKKRADFMEDAALILGGTVTGQAKGKSIRLPTVQAVFRRLCRDGLKGDNRALRRVIELMLTLEQAAREKAKEKGKETARSREFRQKFCRRFDPDDSESRREERKEPDPKREELKRRADAMVREERRRLMREARRSQS